jgi:hypothetical protein
MMPGASCFTRQNKQPFYYLIFVQSITILTEETVQTIACHQLLHATHTINALPTVLKVLLFLLSHVCSKHQKVMWLILRFWWIYMKLLAHKKVVLVCCLSVWMYVRMCTSLAPEWFNRTYSCSVLKSLSILGRCLVNVNTPPTKLGTLRISPKHNLIIFSNVAKMTLIKFQ